MIERQFQFIRRCFLTNSPVCGRNPQVKPNQAFVAMPFSNEYDDVYESIKTVLDQLGIQVIRADKKFATSALSCNICELTQESRFVICDISEKNLNVYLELGLAYGLSRIVLLLYHGDIPDIMTNASDLSGLWLTQYERSHLSKFREELEHKLSVLKTFEYAFDPYLSNYMYRVCDLNLDLFVNADQGDTNTQYDITVQRISPDADVGSDNFVMPYHDTPNFPTELEEFNLVAKRFDNKELLEIDWILKSKVWKRFCIKLPSMSVEEYFRFTISMYEKGLYYRDEKSDFYDLQIHYPTESVALQIHFPTSWPITNMSVVDADTGQQALGITKYEFQHHENQNILVIHMTRPKVGATYLLQWEWDDL